MFLKKKCLIVIENRKQFENMLSNIALVFFHLKSKSQ